MKKGFLGNLVDDVFDASTSIVSKTITAPVDIAAKVSNNLSKKLNGYCDYIHDNKDIMCEDCGEPPDKAKFKLKYPSDKKPRYLCEHCKIELVSIVNSGG